MKKIFILMTLGVCILFSGCQTLLSSIQIIDDNQIISGADIYIDTIVMYEKLNHPEDVQKMINYCDKILAIEDTLELEISFNMAIDSLMYKYKNNLPALLALTALKNKFEIKDGNVVLDSGAIRTVKVFVEMFKSKLEE